MTVMRSSGDWDVYPECSGWDIVLVRTGPAYVSAGVTVSPGEQVGIEAKVHPNLRVINQVVGGRSRRVGPHYRAALVPAVTPDFREVARLLKFHAWDEQTVASWHSATHPVGQLGLRWRESHAKPLWLPPVASQRAAGVPCPAPLSPWRVKALKLCNRLCERGYVTSADFKELDLSIQLWRVNKWLVDDGTREGRHFKFVRGPGAKPPDEGWEDVSAQLGCDV